MPVSFPGDRRARAAVRVIALTGALLCALAPTTPALARDVTVTTFDGTHIVAHYSPASNRAAGQRVPTVLIGPGYPTRGDMNPDQDTSDNIGQASLRAAGYNTLTWDPRGTGGSTGRISFDSPDYEARDVQSLIDFVASQPEAQLDGPNDPRVGMSGSSYGGGIQLAVAAIDHRVDAIIPDVTWNSLGTSFFPEGTVSTGWSVLICGNGMAAGLPSKFIGPATAVLANADSPLKASCLESVGGAVSAANRQWWIDRTPPGLRQKIAAPTLITHGTIDTLFSLRQAIDNYEILRANGVPVKMLWHCTGHGTCLTSLGEPGHVRAADLAWFDRWLKGNTAADTGPGFEWLADDGVWRGGSAYPLADAGTIDATGSDFRSLGLSLLSSTSGSAFAATPAANAVTVTFSAPPAGSDIVGTPTLRLRYKGNALPAPTYLFAQVVDAAANRVVGSQATPIPVTLDDREHTVERSLAPIAVHAGAGARYRLQVTPGTGLFSGQRSTGGVVIRQLDASLPLVDTSNAGSAKRRTPRRLVLRVSSRRVAGGRRLTIRTRLRSKPCNGRVSFRVSAAGRTTRASVRVPSSCAIVHGVTVHVGSRARVIVAATFRGNAELAPRSARAVVYRVP